MLKLAALLLGSASGLVNIPPRRYACDNGACMPLGFGKREGVSQAVCLLTCGGKGNLWPYPSGEAHIKEGSVLPFSTNDIEFKYTSAKNSQPLLEKAVTEFLGTLEKTAGRKVSSAVGGAVHFDVATGIKQLNMDTDESYKLRIRAVNPCTEAAPCMHVNDKTCMERTSKTGKSVKSGGICAAGTNDCDLSPSLCAISPDITITANNFFGARHGLETLSQLVAYDAVSREMKVAGEVTIADAPGFKYRGLLVDTSRQFFSMDLLRRTVKAMGMNKLNTLHLHLSDTPSFPLELRSQPNVTVYGAYGGLKYYTWNEMADLVEYATVCGVRVVPELDVPAHVNFGWQDWPEEAGMGELVICDKGDWSVKAVEPPSGQLNLANPNIYSVLRATYDDLVDLFPSDVFHLGGDEVVVGSDDDWASCYNASVDGKDIVDLIKSRGGDRSDPEEFYKLWVEFTHKAADQLKEAYMTRPSRDSPHNATAAAKGKRGGLYKMMQWGGESDGSSVIYNLVDRPDVKQSLSPDDFIIEIWDTLHHDDSAQATRKAAPQAVASDASDARSRLRGRHGASRGAGSIAPSLIRQGYEVVLAHSDYLYLDCGASGWAAPGGYWCGPYHEWYHIYSYINDALSKWEREEGLAREIAMRKILGAETLIWAEIASEENFEQRVWPRTAALAEALWTNPSTGWYEADPRMQQQRARMVARGVRAEALQVQTAWCLDQAPYACTLNSSATPV